MAEPYLSEIRMMAFDFPPQGWAFCDGALLSVQQNQALFGLLGTTFGGDGVSTFALPDFRGRAPMHVGGGHVPGETGGEAAHALTLAEIPAHSHALQASSQNAATPNPSGAVLAAFNNGYVDPSELTTLRPGTLDTVGSGQAHENRQPYLALRFCISLQGSLPAPAST